MNEGIDEMHADVCHDPAGLGIIALPRGVIPWLTSGDVGDVDTERALFGEAAIFDFRASIAGCNRNC